MALPHPPTPPHSTPPLSRGRWRHVWHWDSPSAYFMILSAADVPAHQAVLESANSLCIRVETRYHDRYDRIYLKCPVYAILSCFSREVSSLQILSI